MDRHRSLIRREDYYETEQRRVDQSLQAAHAASYQNPQLGEDCPPWWFWDRFWASLGVDYPSWGWKTQPQTGLTEFGGKPA